ncbi:hypothetical protein G5C51_19475 [Streptomyces sp. A7024]|uniref:Lipoprotein n=1 Tax=Streptomyces coryli TaxID=1128680 RepID=A0A6G4U2Y0_9ACTN|nr:hypothetical protein [Streptomyces coryli]NGN66066.1 hypothetical protein [Streptomyces coryli]
MRKRRIWAVSVAAAAVLALAGCEGNEPTDQGAGGADGGKPSASESASESASPSPSQSSSAAPSKSPSEGSGGGDQGGDTGGGPAVGSTPGPGEGPKGENVCKPAKGDTYLRVLKAERKITGGDVYLTYETGTFDCSGDQGPVFKSQGENATVPVDTKQLKVFAGPVFTGATEGLRRMDAETFLEKLTLEEPGHEFYYRVEVTERFHEGAVTYLFHITDG